MLLSVNYALDRPEFRQEFTYHTQTQTLNETTGKVTLANSTPVAGHGSVQPCERTELHALMSAIAGGQDITEAIIIFTKAPLVAGRIGSPSSSGHFVTYRNLQWLVVDVEVFTPHGHVEAIAVRTGGQNG